MLGRVGADAIESFRGFGRLSVLGARVLLISVSSLPRRRLLVPLMFEIGVRSLPVVAITGAFTGMVLAVQAYAQFHRLRIENLLGAIVSVAMVKELGPVLTALMLAGRVGSAMTAELGTMRVTDQIDALRSMGTDPVAYLAVPRFLACVMLMPVLTAYSDVIGILGGWFVGVKTLTIDPHYYWYHAAFYTDTYDIVCGLVKAVFFGAFLSVICCYKGFHCGEGAKGVGRATTEANVASCMTILVANFFLAVIMWQVRNRFFPYYA
jgi:phospholipid/cholesterol/gamma-HCH transport system permease protein